MRWLVLALIPWPVYGQAVNHNQAEDAFTLCRWATTDLAQRFPPAPTTACAISQHHQSWRLNITLDRRSYFIELVPDDMALSMRGVKQLR